MKAFLMKVAWGTSSLIVVKAGYETYDLWKGILPKMNNIQETESIFSSHKEHTTVLGITRHGKTFAAIHSLARMKDEAVFFYNTQHEKVPSGFTTVDPRQHEWEQVEHLLQKNRKINWIAATKIENMHKEIIFIVDKLYNEEVRNVRLVIDEVHLFKKAALQEIQRVATTGLRWGIRGVFISQRPAKVDNTLYTQSTNHVIFALGNSDYKYLKEQGFPSEEIQAAVNGEPYLFVTFNQKEVSSVKTIKKD
jgi:hypothetical protein